MDKQETEGGRPLLTVFAERAAIISVPIAVFSLLYAFLTYEATWDIAKVSGALDKPVLSLGLAGSRLRSDSPAQVILGSPRLGDSNTVTIGSLPFTLGDEGQKTVDAPTLTFRYPTFLKRRALELMTVEATGSVHTADVRHSLTSDEAFDYSSYDFKSFDPGMGADIEEPVYENQTVVDVDTDATTKDGQRLNVRAHMVYSVPFLVTLSGRDIPASNCTIEIAFARASSWAELEKFAERNIIEPDMKRLRDNLGFWQYLSGLLLRTEKQDVYLSYQPMKEFKASGGSVLSASDSPVSVRRLTYDLLSWRYLFK